MGNPYTDRLDSVAKLTAEQRDMINAILDRHAGELIWDLPSVDEVLFLVERDLDRMTKDKEPGDGT